MKHQNYPSCCGAYMLYDLTQEDLDNMRDEVKKYKFPWGGLGLSTLAYRLIILNEEDEARFGKQLLDMGLKLLSDTSKCKIKRFLYSWSR